MTDPYAHFHSSSAETALPEAQEDAAQVGAEPSSDGRAGHERPRSLGRDAWYELRRNRLFIISAVIIVIIVVIAAFPSLFTSADPRAGDLTRSRLGPSLDGGWFGYDLQGRDIFARTIYGARASVLVGVITTIGVCLIGAVIGLIAGFYSGVVDALLSRLLEIFFGIPLLLGAVLFLSSFPSDLDTPELVTIGKVCVALTVLAWTAVARIMRSTTLQVKQMDYVQAARALGGGAPRLLRRHVLPNAVPSVVVYATIILGVFITVEATLSFLGIGLQAPVVSWGLDISNAQAYVRQSPHMLLFPSAFLSLTVLAFIMLGDAVRDAFDPRQR
jgi:oligopeptide transport system permease protein